VNFFGYGWVWVRLGYPQLGCPIANIPKTTEIFGSPTDNIPDNCRILVGYPQLTKYPRQLKYSGFQSTIEILFQNILKQFVGYIGGWKPEYFSCLGYFVSCGYPTRTHTHTRGNSLAHVWLKHAKNLISLIIKKRR